MTAVVRADVAEALHEHRRALELEALLLGPLEDAEHQPLPRRLLPAEGPPARHWLAGDDALDHLLLRRPDHVRVGVHHPRHRLAVRADVRRGDVVLGADVLAERVGEAARDPLELELRDRVRIELDAALSSAEREAQERGLPRHHGGERLDVVQRDLRVVAHAALERADEVVVLDPVALEESDLSVVHADGEVDDELVLRLAEDRLNVGLDLRDLRGSIEVVLHDLVEIVLLGRPGQPGGRNRRHQLVGHGSFLGD